MKHEMREIKEHDRDVMTEAYDALPPDARRLYRLIEAVGMAIEAYDADTLGVVADMGRYQSCHCPLGHILQDVVGAELEKRKLYDALDDDEVIYEEDEDGDGDYVAEEDKEIEQ